MTDEPTESTPHLTAASPPPARARPRANARAADTPILERLQDLADALAAEWGVAPVAVVRNARLRTTAGRALAPQRRIEVAAWLLGAPWPLVEDTLRHEFAHILAKTLVPRSRDHGDLWRAFAVALGARPRAAYRAEEMALHWSRVTFYRCDRGCRVPRRTPYPRRRLRWLRCRRHALPLTLEAAPLPTPLRTTRD